MIPRLLIFLVLSCPFWSIAHTVSEKPIEIVFWHSLAGHLGAEVNELAKGFNQSQSKFTVRPVYKGDYNECLTSLTAAFRAHQAPALVQVFEVGTLTMLSPSGIIKPVDEVMKQNGMTLPKDNFFPAVLNYYSVNNQLAAMPFNTSIPVMFYNADALAKVGYSSDNFPETWDEFEILAAKLRDSGYKCAYSTANPAWILIESFSAIHGLPVINKDQTLAVYNTPMLIKFLARLKSWQKNHYFEYGGRTDDSSILFTSGRCPLYTQSSGAYMSFVEMVSFRVGLAAIPIDNTISTHRHTNISGGGAVWITQGQTNDVYEGVAQFLTYLAKPETQTRWHQNTGYLPLGITGIYEKIELHSSLKTLRLAKKELNHNQKSLNVSRVQNQIRVINEESLEAVFAGIKSPKQAMEDAVKRSNLALLRFRRNTKA